MNQPMIERCPVGCDTELEHTDIKLPEGCLRRCPECGQLVSACTDERYHASMQDFDVEEGTMPGGKSARRHRKRIGAILSRAMRLLDRPTERIRLLDIGCSSGSVLMIARDMGIAGIHGVEPAEKAAKTAQSAGFDVHIGTLEDAGYPDSSFDLATLFEVIEHLPAALPLAREVHRILRPGGLWLIGTGNARSWTARRLRDRWEYYSIARNGGHISFFNPTSIRKLADRSGFDIAYITTKRMLSAPPEQRNAIHKLVDEIGALPARMTGNGHDMLAALRKP